MAANFASRKYPKQFRVTALLLEAVIFAYIPYYANINEIMNVLRVRGASNADCRIFHCSSGRTSSPIKSCR